MNIPEGRILANRLDNDFDTTPPSSRKQQRLKLYNMAT